MPYGKTIEEWKEIYKNLPEWKKEDLADDARDVLLEIRRHQKEQDGDYDYDEEERIRR